MVRAYLLCFVRSAPPYLQNQISTVRTFSFTERGNLIFDSEMEIYTGKFIHDILIMIPRQNNHEKYLTIFPFVKIEVKQADPVIHELALLIESAHQTAEERFSIINPLFNRMDLYCDETFLRLEKDTELFAISVSSIKYALYEEYSDVLFLLFNNRHLHKFDLSHKTHYIYVIEERRNCIINFFQNLCNRFRITWIWHKLNRRCDGSRNSLNAKYPRYK